MKTFIITAIATTVSAIAIAAVFYVAINNAKEDDTLAVTNTTGEAIKLGPHKVDAGETIVRRGIPLAICKKTTESRLGSIYKGLTSRILVDTDAMYKVRVWMPKDIITLTCFDSEMISAKHKYS